MSKKLSITVLAVAALALPAGATATPSSSNTKNAAKLCKALRKAAGEANFAAMFGTNKNKRNAFGKCVSKNARADARQDVAARNRAVEACRAEQSQDSAAFDQKYGTNKNKQNAFGKCVSQKSAENKAAADAQDQNSVNAARACRDEQSKDRDAFAKKYGSNANDRNAFGKCVSAHSEANGTS